VNGVGGAGVEVSDGNSLAHPGTMVMWRNAHSLLTLASCPQSTGKCVHAHILYSVGPLMPILHRLAASLNAVPSMVLNVVGSSRCLFPPI
jgi:catechol-2,3-dioxygenase